MWRQVEAVVPRNGYAKMRLVNVPELGMASGLMVNLETCS
jgi:hypothetical protein